MPAGRIAGLGATPDFHHGLLALAALASAFLMLGCARSSKSDEQIPASGKPSGDQAASLVLRPTALPDLSGMAVPVQEQLRAQYELLTSAKSNPATSKADLAAAYGGVGRQIGRASCRERVYVLV